MLLIGYIKYHRYAHPSDEFYGIDRQEKEKG
jgi:hypothetical protein